MAIKLTQGADSTIVTAATRAGMATSPKDYSGIFDSVSKSYDAATQASAEAWGQIAGTIAVVGAELQKNAEVYSDVAQRIFNAGGTQELVDDVYSIKDELRALGSFGGKFGDRETRRKRSEILARRNKLFAEVDGWGDSLEEASLAAKNGLLDYNLMGGDVEFVNAIIASNTSNKITSEGNEARVSRDPKTGELIYTLHDMNSGGAAIPGKTMSLSSFKTLIQDSAKDVDNVTGTFLTGITDGAENMGATYGGAMDEYNKGKLLTSLDSMTSNAATLRRGMRTKFGHSNTSFYDELTGPNQTELSSKYFTLMLGNVANVKDGEIKAGALGDVKDTDGSGGISQQEINDQYVLFQNSILSGEGPMAKALFTDFVTNRAEEAYNFGAKQYNKKNPASTSDDKIDFYSKGKGVQLLNDQYLSGGQAESLYTNIQNGIRFTAKDPITKEINDYSYHIIDGEGGWYENYQEGDTPATKESYIGPEANDIAKVFTNDSRFMNLKTELQETVDLKGESTTKETRQAGTFDPATNISIETIKGEDNLIADDLNDMIPPPGDERNKGNYEFKAKGGSAALGFQVIGLYKSGGDLMTYPAVYPPGHEKAGQPHPAAGKNVVIGTNSKTIERRKKDLEELMDILKTFELYDYIPKQLPG
jgi:hypothetical protein